MSYRLKEVILKEVIAQSTEAANIFKELKAITIKALRNTNPETEIEMINPVVPIAPKTPPAPSPINKALTTRAMTLVNVEEIQQEAALVQLSNG